MKYISILVLAFIFVACTNSKESEIPTSKVKKETFYIDIYEEGEVKAIQSININSPTISWRYGMLKITQLVDDGKEVGVGDTLVVFDPSEVKKAIVDAESRLEIHKAELEQMKAQHQSDLEELNADLEVTQLSQQISKIRFESSTYEANVTKKEIQLNLEKANIALEKAQSQIENRKKIQSEEIGQKMLNIRQSQAELNDSYKTLEMLTLTASTPGIAIIRRNWSSNAKFQIGDQVWSGQPMIELPDLNALKADVNINEVDISKITKGLHVQIRPDAFSDSVYTGSVLSVANLAINKDNRSKIKVFPVGIAINGGKNNLMPGLTVSCRLIIDQIPDVLSIPLEALFREGATDYAYVKSGNSFKKKEIKTGQQNTDFIIVNEGLDESDLVALTNPFATEEETKKE